MHERLGLIHIYCGDGKGKTTAAMGLALRAMGNGVRVVVVQFLKNGASGEIDLLKKLGAVVLYNEGKTKFSFNMNEAERIECEKTHCANLQQAIALCNEEKCSMLILDEALGAISSGLLDESLIEELLTSKAYTLEIVITGRNPSDRLIELADYVSEIKKVKHPYDRGVLARDGIER